MAQENPALLERYRRLDGRITLTGIQAIVRLPLDQNRRDREAGLRIGTYFSGYQGSPLGGIDRQVRLAAPLMREHDIRFELGINEDLAATAIFGTQLLDVMPHKNYDGVLGIWYGKSPGLDRSGDILRHAQYLGTSRHGASLILTGDDPAIKSSSLPSDSTIALYDWFYPVFYPGNSTEVLEYGLHAVAMSRYSGLWTALKIVTNVADGGGTVEVYPGQAAAVIPELEIDGEPFKKKQDPRMMPPFNLEVERLIHYERLVAAKAYIRANGLNRITTRGENDRVGIISMGKTYYDLRLALEILGLDEEGLKAAGIRTYKLGVISPVEPEGLREFAEGLDEILVVEEKRPFLEMQICHELYNAPSRPSIYGKTGPRGEPLFQKNNELQPEIIAARLAGYLGERLERKDLQERVQRLDNIAGRSYRITANRIPYYCSGCPHNISTKIPEGAVAGGGIGCHGLAFFMERGVGWFAHMGGEGAPWIGLNHYVDKDHIFQNVGDGTFFHSGSKALEACIAAKVNMTFKILCNGTVAMTGGQEVVAGMEPLAIARRLELEGVAEIVIVPEETAKYPRRRVSGKITVRPKDDYNQVMLDLRKVEGVTAIIFDQQCATEKRRLRTQGKMETPDRRVFVHEGICEGCGDCGVKSNCLSVIPVETGYGRKTAIHQSSCNFEFSCLQGDCPALMTVHLDAGAAAAPRAGPSATVQQPPPEPAQKAQLGEPYKIMMAGVGGSGVVTTDALLMEAAFSEGLHVVHLDQTGLSQKAGSVMSNIIIAKTKLTRPAKISAGEADLLLAFDLLSSVVADNLHRLHPDCSTAVVNTHRSHTGETIRDVKAEYPPEDGMLAELERFSNKESMIVVDAEQITTALFGNARSNNIFLLGVAYQAGLLPLKAESVEAAIAVNGVAVEQNVQAFRWGRRYRQDPDSVKNLTGGEAEPPDPIQKALEKLQDLAPGQVEPFRRMAQPLSGNRRLTEIMAPRLADLILSRNAAYARNYLDFVRKVVDEEARRTPGRTELGEAVARWLFKLMAYKDEYEVARQVLQHPVRRQLAQRYRGPFKIRLNLHPPLLRAMGLKKKLPLGEWFVPVLRMVYGLRGLRGTWLDPFGHAHIRREERRLIGWYRALVESLLGGLTHENHGVAVTIARCPDNIRGFESVKQRTIGETEQEVEALLAAYREKGVTKEAG